MREIRIAVIGYGYWSPKLIRNIERIDRLKLAAICEKDEARHEFIREANPGVPIYRHYEDICAESSIDAVIVATIPSSHYRIAKRSLESGKHVLVEKPLALTVEESSILCGLARTSKRILMVDHTYLYSPAIIKLKELIQDGELGAPYSVESVRVNLGLFQKDTNVVWDLAPHDFSILLSLFSERPTHISATGSKTVVHPRQKRGQESLAHITLYYESGLIAHIHVSWISPVKVRQITIMGSERMARYDQLADQPITIYDQGIYPVDSDEESGPLFTYKAGEASHPPVESNTEDLLAMLEDFRGAVEHGTVPRSSPSLALDVVRLLSVADRSMKAGGRRVRISYRNGNPFQALLARLRPR